MFLKIAPFGKPLQKAIKSNNPPTNDVYLYIGAKAWEEGYKSSFIARPTRTLILPPGDSPKFYIWPVINLDILIFDTSGCDENLIESLMEELMQCGANAVRFISFEKKLTAVYKREP